MPRIAVIDDEESMRDLICSLLEDIPDIEIRCAADRASGEQLVASEQFDIVILDIDLGSPKDKYGGFSILSSLSGRQVTTLVVSGVPESNLAGVAISLDAYDFIAKPINHLDFLNKFDHALRAQDARSGASQDLFETTTLPPHLTLDTTRQFGYRWKNSPVALTMTQSRLVQCLIEQPGQTVEHSRLAAQLKFTNDRRAIATHISDVRRQFLVVDKTFSAIANDPGKGYVWKKNS